MLWLSRADTIYSARDELYEAAGEVLTEDCSERIGQLEEAPTYTNKLLAEIQDRLEGRAAGDGELSLSIPEPGKALQLIELFCRLLSCWRLSPAGRPWPG